jgi:hypothetical protein
MSDAVWKGALGIGKFNKETLPDLIRNNLSRSQLRESIHLREANEDFEFSKLVALVALHEQSCNHPGFLEHYNIMAPNKLPATEDARFARMERSELESIVLSFIN